MENTPSVKANSALGVAVAIGLIVFGILLSGAVSRARSDDRFVTVKGLAERDVPADLVIWPIGYKEAAADLATLNARLRQKNAAIIAFLKEAGFDDTEIIVTPAVITDTQAEAFEARGSAEYRFKGESTVTLRSSKVDKALAAMARTSDLIGKGIAIARENWEFKTEFVYTKLNEIKPGMIEEATKNARGAAEKFAADSGSGLGKIRRATQGLFSIETPDKSRPNMKQVRVVTTVDYFLKD